MLSAVFRRSTFTAQKVLHWAGPPQRCWTSALTAVSGSVSVSSSWPSTTRHQCPERDTGNVKRCALLCAGRTKLFQRIHTHDSLFPMRSQHFHSSTVRLKKRVQPEPPPRELDLLRYDMKNMWEAPKPALYLGFAGLIPFVIPTVFMAMTENYYPDLAYAQVAYGASIVSFLGGARWGFALPESSPAKPDWINLANSVVPSLIAWVTMLMSDTIVPASIMVIMGLGISLHYDLSLLPTYPSWFKALRAILTIVAFFSLLGTLTMNGLFPEKKIFWD